MTFGEKLLAVRLERGYKTRAQFAEELGFSANVIRNYETGLREPGLEFVSKACIFLDISADYMLGTIDVPLRISQISEEHNDPNETRIISSYRKMDDLSKYLTVFLSQRLAEKSGKGSEETADILKTADELWGGEAKVIDMSFLNAAHKKDTYTDADMKHDDDIMTGEDF